MRKWIIRAALFMVLMASTVYAHVAGSFADFLVGIQDESTTEKLKNEIKATKKEIERLTPQVEQLKAEYNEKANGAVTKLQFYNTIGLDTYVNFILQSEDIVDILANQRMIEKKVEEDLWELNQLYLTYMPLKLAADSLHGHVKMLHMIEENLQAREEFFAKNKDLNSVGLANLTLSNWEENAGSLDEILYQDSELLNGNIKELVTRKTTRSPFRLEEALFNQKSNLTYYFRADHVYVHFRNKNADVILIGTVSQTNENTASLQFEAGFLNGVLLSSDLLGQLTGFELDYSKLNPGSKGFYVEHMNGAIVIQPAENAVE